MKQIIATFVIASIATWSVSSMAHAAVFPAAAWKVCAPSAAQKAKIDAFKRKVQGSGVIVKDGCQIAQWGNYKTSTTWGSASKPLLSLLLLYGTQQGNVGSVDDLVNPVVQKHFGKPLSAKDSGMTWAHLADMVSGYARGEAPGERWAYNDFAISLYRILLETSHGASLDKAFAPFKTTMRFQDRAGFPLGGGREWKASPRDMARVGWLFLNEGNWNGKQMLPARFWDTYFKPQVDHTTPRSTKAGTDYLGVGTVGGSSNQTSMGPGYYGFSLWFNKATNGKCFWPNAPADAYQFNGHWGKEVMAVLPGCNAVAAVKGSWGTMQPGISGGMNQTMDLLKQAVCN